MLSFSGWLVFLPKIQLKSSKDDPFITYVEIVCRLFHNLKFHFLNNFRNYNCGIFFKKTLEHNLLIILKKIKKVMDIGNVISEWRSHKNLKQFQLAQDANIPVTVLSKIENGKRKPNLIQLEKISSALDIPLPILMFLSLNIDDIKEDRRNVFLNIKNEFKLMLADII